MAKKEITKKEKLELKNEMVDSLREQVLYDIDKEIKSTIKSNVEIYKNDMKKEMLDHLNDEVNAAIKREEKRFIRSKNVALFKKNVVIVILLCIIGYFGYCLYDAKYFKFMQTDCGEGEVCNNKINQSSDKVDNENNEVVKDEAWYLENYSYLLDVSRITLTTNNVNAYYLYSGDHKMRDVRMSYLLNIAYSGIVKNDIKSSSSSVVVSGEALKMAFHKIFGDLEYTPTNFSYGCLDFIYNDAKDRYTAENIKCGTNTTEIVENIETIYEEDHVLYMITNATLYDNEEKSCYDFSDLYEPILENIEKENISENSKKLNRYQYEYEFIDDAYYLKAITKLK